MFRAAETRTNAVALSTRSNAHARHTRQCITVHGGDSREAGIGVHLGAATGSGMAKARAQRRTLASPVLRARALAQTARAHHTAPPVGCLVA